MFSCGEVMIIRFSQIMKKQKAGFKICLKQKVPQEKYMVVVPAAILNLDQTLKHYSLTLSQRKKLSGALIGITLITAVRAFLFPLVYQITRQNLILHFR